MSQKWDRSLRSQLCAAEGKIPVPCDVATENKVMAAAIRKPDDFVDKRDLALYQVLCKKCSQFSH